ncbi:hypothetical protein ACFFQF_32710 [Haladaptatus pallidirubidus]|uniref:Uncharacterized protein n=1 Tax=Haladaptatus pallidirubidus TaxID=1008152 RepID=A0AAV3UQ24_9EURY|nr:hypothetical protein [Haladaptatus pallidirubidus]
MTARNIFQVVTDRTEVAIHQINIPDAVPEDAEDGLTNSLKKLADIVRA